MCSDPALILALQSLFNLTLKPFPHIDKYSKLNQTIPKQLEVTGRWQVIGVSNRNQHRCNFK